MAEPLEHKAVSVGGRSRPGPAPSQPCGTVSAYKRHQRNGEELDDACRAAWAEYQRDLYHRRQERKAAAAEGAAS